jgi:hypothetical protein
VCQSPKTASTLACSGAPPTKARQASWIPQSFKHIVLAHLLLFLARLGPELRCADGIAAITKQLIVRSMLLGLGQRKADNVTVNGVTLERGAQFVLQAKGKTPIVGSVFTVIENTAGTPINGNLVLIWPIGKSSTPPPMTGQRQATMAATATISH